MSLFLWAREREFSGLYTVNLNIRLLFFLFSHSSVDIFRKNLRIKSAGRLYTFCYLLYHQNRCIYFALSNQASSSIDCIFLVSLTSIFCRWIDLEEDDIWVGDGRSGSSQFYFWYFFRFFFSLSLLSLATACSQCQLNIKKKWLWYTRIRQSSSLT